MNIDISFFLGKSYADQRSKKRPRKQPHHYPRLPQVGADQRPISGTQMGGPSQVSTNWVGTLLGYTVQLNENAYPFYMRQEILLNNYKESP